MKKNVYTFKQYLRRCSTFEHLHVARDVVCKHSVAQQNSCLHPRLFRACLCAIASQKQFSYPEGKEVHALLCFFLLSVTMETFTVLVMYTEGDYGGERVKKYWSLISRLSNLYKTCSKRDRCDCDDCCDTWFGVLSGTQLSSHVGKFCITPLIRYTSSSSLA